MTQQPSTTVQPDMAGTFAVYLMPDGRAGLVLDVTGRGESRHMVPKIIVDMVMHGKKPSMKMLMGIMKGDK